MKSDIGIYGYLAGIVNAVLLQPLDNIKMALIFPPKQLNLSNRFISNLGVASQFLWKEQRFQGFYKGLVPNLMKTGIGSAFYFWSLRSMENIVGKNDFFASFCLSFFARIFSTVVSNPFSVIETRFEMLGENQWRGTMAESFHKIYKFEGINGFFKGCLATCIKEGGFAGLYYGFYLEGKKQGLTSFWSGMTAGFIATLASHPFEIIRANMQVMVAIQQEQMLQFQVTNLLRNGGILRGVAPRLLKKPLANTLGFLAFEAMEQMNE